MLSQQDVRRILGRFDDPEISEIMALAPGCEGEQDPPSR
jgi:hypothetical protein